MTPHGPTSGPRSRAERRRDTEHRLTHDVDVWVASASPDGTPHLVPLSFDWDGETLLLATSAQSPTGRNLAATGFDPRELTTPYHWFRVTPRRVPAWREVDEQTGRELMRDGRWSA